MFPNGGQFIAVRIHAKSDKGRQIELEQAIPALKIRIEAEKGCVSCKCIKEPIEKTSL